MSSFLITDIRIFDGQDIIDNGSVLIQNGKIAKISQDPLSFNGKTISEPGHTLLPGFIDAHVHIDFGQESGLAQGLRFGVTTQCDLGNAPFQIENLREMVRKGDCSDVKAAVKSATPEGGWPAPLLKRNGIELPPDENPLKTEEDGVEFVRAQVQAGADYIKILHESGTAFGMELPKLPTAVEKGIIDEAHRANLIVLAHSFTLDDALEILSLGIDGLAHAIIDKPPTNELVEAFQKTDAFCIPTLAVIGSNTSEGRMVQEKFASDVRVQALLIEGGREKMCQCLAMTSADQGSLRNAIEMVRRLKEAGVDVVCGTDATGIAPGTAYGLSLHQELELYVTECGFSPIEALRSATSLAAKRFGLGDRGSIKEGMRADLVLVEGDPTKLIHSTLDLRGVWVAGELCSYYKDRI